MAVAVLSGKFALEYLPGLFPRGSPLASQAPAHNPQGVGSSEWRPETDSDASAPRFSVAPTFLVEDRHWGAVDGWTIFEAAQTGCFAKKSFPDNATLVLGRLKRSGDFVLAMSGSVPKTEGRTLTLVFDGTRRRRPYFDEKTNMVVGRYGAEAGIVNEISRSARLQVSGERSQAVTLPLVGTRAAMAAVSDCVRAIVLNDVDRRVPSVALPDNSLCEDKPPNGRLLTKRGGARAQGHRMTVRNSPQGDAIIKVRHQDSGKLAYSFLVHRNEEASINGIADGNYRLQFAYGEALLENCTDFLNPRASEFDRSVRFATRVERTRKSVTTYTETFTATLYAVKDGNAPTSQIAQGDFLRD